MCERLPVWAILEMQKNPENSGKNRPLAVGAPGRPSFGTENESPIPNFECAGLSFEFRSVCSLLEYREQADGQIGYRAPGLGPDCALFCAARKVSRVAHGSRSEERRVGKEWRGRWWRMECK